MQTADSQVRSAGTRLGDPAGIGVRAVCITDHAAWFGVAEATGDARSWGAAERWLGDRVDGHAARESLTWIAVRDDEIVNVTMLDRVPDPADAAVVLSYWTAPPVRCRGWTAWIVATAIRRSAPLLSPSTSLRATVRHDNHASLGVLLHCGFTYEPIERPDGIRVLGRSLQEA